MIALRTFDEKPCDFNVSAEALAFHITQVTVVSFVQDFSRTARTRAACVSLSLFNDVNQREGFIHPSIDLAGTKLHRSPFGQYRQIVVSCVGFSHEVVGAGRHRVPQWLRLYERPRFSVKRFVMFFFEIL